MELRSPQSSGVDASAGGENADEAIAREFDAYLARIASAYTAPLAESVRAREAEFKQRSEGAIKAAGALHAALVAEANHLRQWVSTTLTEQQKTYEEALDRILRETEHRIEDVTRSEMTRRLTWLTAGLWVVAIAQVALVALVVWLHVVRP